MILICGSAGFLGSCVVGALFEKGIYPIAYDNLLYRPDFLDDRAEFIRGDVRDKNQLLSVIRNSEIDCIIWLAAIVGDVACKENEQLAIDTNVTALRWLVENYKGRLIFTSSCSAYGVQDELADETSELNPQSLYAVTKIEGEKLLADRPDTLILRLGTLHGISDRMRFDLIVNTMTRHAVEKCKITVMNGEFSRPLTCVDDVAHLIASAYNQKKWCGTYNVAHQNVTIREIADEVAKYAGAQIVEEPSQNPDKRSYQVDSRKAVDELHFHPRFHIKDSIGRIKQLLQSGRLRDTSEAKYDNVLALRERFNVSTNTH